MGLGSRAVCAAAALVLAGCQKPLEAPGNPGVCWRLAPAMNGQQDFKPFATDIDTLENCAARLEGLHLAHGQPMVGAFQGRFIYVTDEDVTVAANASSQRYRVFTPQQRAKIDEGFSALKARERSQ
ncbi:MAG TPA: hypothetical protein VFW47_03980 [Phenylobacterium sp.]|nr:hypothetical protein [Phenylobacterium sp.]